MIPGISEMRQATEGYFFFKLKKLRLSNNNLNCSYSFYFLESSESKLYE